MAARGMASCGHSAVGVGVAGGHMDSRVLPRNEGSRHVALSLDSVVLSGPWVRCWRGIMATGRPFPPAAEGCHRKSTCCAWPLRTASDPLGEWVVGVSNVIDTQG